jgi:hypothetical protein
MDATVTEEAVQGLGKAARFQFFALCLSSVLLRAWQRKAWNSAVEIVNSQVGTGGDSTARISSFVDESQSQRIKVVGRDVENVKAA